MYLFLNSFALFWSFNPCHVCTPFPTPFPYTPIACCRQCNSELVQHEYPYKPVTIYVPIAFTCRETCMRDMHTIAYCCLSYGSPFVSWNHLPCVNCPMFGGVRRTLNDIIISHNI